MVSRAASEGSGIVGADGQLAVERAGQRRLQVGRAVDQDDLPGEAEQAGCRERRAGIAVLQVQVGGEGRSGQLERRGRPGRCQIEADRAVGGAVDADGLGRARGRDRGGQDLLGVGQGRERRGALTCADGDDGGDGEREGSCLRDADDQGPQGTGTMDVRPKDAPGQALRDARMCQTLEDGGCGGAGGAAGGGCGVVPHAGRPGGGATVSNWTSIPPTQPAATL